MNANPPGPSLDPVSQARWSGILRSATGRVFVLTLLGMVVALAVDILIATRLGAGAFADALLIGLSLPLLIDVVTRDSTRFSLVPLFVRRRDAGSPGPFDDFVTRVLNGGAFGGLLIALVAGIAAPSIVRLIGPGLSEDAAHSAARVLRLSLPLLGLAPLISLQSAYLNSRKQFDPVAARSLVTRGTVLIGIVVATSLWTFSDTVAVGHSVGFVIFACGLALATRHVGFAYRGLRLPRIAELHLIGAATIWPLLGLAVLRLTRVAERAIASTVAVGGVAALYFAFRLFSAAQSLIGVTLATTRLPTLSAQAARGERRALWRELWRLLLLTAVLALPLVVACLLYAGPIVAAIYGHGSFGRESVSMTSTVLMWLALGLLPNCAIPVLNASLYALGEYRVVFLVTLTSALLDVVLAWVLSGYLGIAGIAVAVSVSSTLTAVSLLVAAGRTGFFSSAPKDADPA